MGQRWHSSVSEREDKIKSLALSKDIRFVSSAQEPTNLTEWDRFSLYNDTAVPQLKSNKNLTGSPSIVFAQPELITRG